MSPSRDVNLVGVLSDLELVLTEDDYKMLRRNILLDALKLSDELSNDASTKVLFAMGVITIYRVCFLRKYWGRNRRER